MRKPGQVFNGQPSLSEGVKRALDLDGDAFGFLDPATRVAINALDLNDAQYAKLFGVQQYSGGRDCPAVVGQSGIFELVNPATTRKIVRVRRITISNSGVAAAFWWGTIPPNSAIIPALNNILGITPGVRDSRNTNPLGGSSSSSTTARVASTLGAVQLGEIINLPAGSNAQIVLDPLCTLAPGGIFYIYCGTANNSFIVGAAWDERFALAQEVNFPNQ